MISKRHLLQKLQRDPVKFMLARMLKWEPAPDLRPGYTIVLGTPWMLRELLAVNLRFLEKMNNEELDRINIVFDRTPQPGGDEFIEQTKREFPNLPLHFQFHAEKPGKLIQKVNRSKFYASMNWYLGLNAARTKYAVLHDFDLYPYDQDFFRKIYRAMKTKQLRFSGAEHTPFDGLTSDDALIGTWELGVDAEWLRSDFRPVDVFHSVVKVNGRWVDLDAFSAIQSRTRERELAEGAGPESFAHVKNLCSTYLRYSEGKPAKVAWRLHFLWYLQSLVQGEGALDDVMDAMDNATGAVLDVRGHPINFAEVHCTCANVLVNQVTPMEGALYGGVREHVSRYFDGFARFLGQFGDRSDSK